MNKSVQKMGSIFADILLRTLEGSETFCRHEIVHPLTKAPLGISTSLLRDDGHRTKGAVMVFTDLTETKELESKTKDLERLRFWSTLAGRMAQEIRNPLVAVKTFAQLLPDKYGDEEFRSQFFAVVMGEIDRLNKIIEGLLEFAQPRENRFIKEDVNEILDAVMQSRTARIQELRVKIVRQIPAERFFVMADREHLAKAMAHVVDNGLEAMPDSGRLRFRSHKVRAPSLNGRPPRPHQPQEWVEILFEDSGPGIPLENMVDIFSPFFTTKIKGMGFGLPIALRIIQDHQGRIEVESEPGRGSKFRILLPLELNSPSSTPPRDAPTA
jgi:signal transduction histidine kinase